MSHATQEQQKNNTINQLHTTHSVSYHQLTDIANAFQISSGQSFAIGSIQGILEYLRTGKTIAITNNHSATRRITSAKDLDNILNTIAPNITLFSDPDFKAYF